MLTKLSIKLVDFELFLRCNDKSWVCVKSRKMQKLVMNYSNQIFYPAEARRSLKIKILLCQTIKG